MQRPHLLICVFLALGGCETLPPDGSPQVQTPAQARRADLPNALTSPLRDANLLRSKIPEVLLRALDSPYGRPPTVTCDWVVAELLPLNGALGVDLGEPDLDEHTLGERGAENVLSAIAGAASGAMPMRAWVRELSGAQTHDKYVSAAITAGQVRRAYLKGLGESRGCAPPARPHGH